MGPLQELLASDHRQTFEFFFVGLKELSDPTVNHQELLYNASVLAHFAQVSTHAVSDLSTPASLANVFEKFVLDTSHAADGEMLEAAGAQCLLLSGFFEDQVGGGRHPIHWYVKLGAGFYQRASAHQQSDGKARLLHAIARKFEPWRRLHAELGRELRDRPYLLPPKIS